MEQEDQCRMAGEPREPIFDGDFSFNTGELRRFTFYDYFFFVAILAISTMIGFYHAWRDRLLMNMEDYLMAGRVMSSVPVGLSILASSSSAITLIGTPAELYKYNTIYMWIGLSLIAVIALSAHVYMPVFYNLRVTSAYEYLEKRFDQNVRKVAACVFVIQLTMYMPLVLYAPSVALNAVTGLNLWLSILSVGIVCTTYTALGGIKAVIWTDTFQTLFSMFVLLLLLICAALTIGSFGVVWESAARTNRILFSDFRLSPAVRHSVWSLVIGGTFTWMPTFAVSQVNIQRYLTSRSLKQAKIALWLNVPGLCLAIYLCCFIGLYMAAFYENCDPLKTNVITAADQLVPLFVMDILGNYAGLPGFFIAGIFCATLSTISSCLNSVAGVIFEDLVRHCTSTPIREQRARLITQSISFIFGIICLELTFLSHKFGNIMQGTFALNAVVAGPMLGLFSLGMFFPWANTKGAFIGLFGAIFFMIMMYTSQVTGPLEMASTCVSNCNVTVLHKFSQVSQLTPDTAQASVNTEVNSLRRVSYLWYNLIAATICISLGLVGSYITGLQKPEKVDPRLIVPVFDVVFPLYYLPESIRAKLRFGIDHTGKFDREPPNHLFSTPSSSSVQDRSEASLGFKRSVVAGLSKQLYGEKYQETEL